MCDWQLVVKPLTFHLGCTGGKNSSLVIGECFWSFSQKHLSCLCVSFLYFFFFFRMEFLRMKLFCSPLVQKNWFRSWVLQAAVGFSQSFVWQSSPWPLLRDTNCCSGSLQGVMRCKLSSSQPWQQMSSWVLQICMFFSWYHWNIFTALSWLRCREWVF